MAGQGWRSGSLSPPKLGFFVKNSVLGPLLVLLFAATANSQALVSGAPFHLGYMMVDQHTEELIATASVPSFPVPPGASYQLGLSIIDAYHRTVAEKIIPVSQSNEEIRLPLASVSPGTYQVVVRLLDGGGKELARDTRPMQKPNGAPSWLNNSIGKSDEVPPPWTPIKINGETIQVWGRSYDFHGAVALPSSIVSNGQTLTAGSATLSCDGQAAVVQQPAIWTENSPAVSVAEGSAQVSDLRIQTETRIEYDGFAWVKLTLEPRGKTATLRNLTLELPLRREASTLVNSIRHGQMQTNQKGALPPEGWRLNLLEKPLFWVGNEKGGFEWFAEDLKGWRWKDPEKTLEIIPEGDINLVRWRIIEADKPVVIDKPLVLSFGYQATPVRPQNPQRSSWRQGSNIQMWLPWLTVWNYPDAACISPVSRKALQVWQGRGMRIFHYLVVGSMSPDVPEWTWWAQIWQQTPPARSVLVGTGDDPAWGSIRSALVGANPQSFTDFYMFKLQTAIREVPLKNIYFDNVYLTPCDNADAGCGWVDFEGNKRPSFPLLGLREFAKRAYVLLKQERPDGMIVHHSSGEPVSPVNGFADIVVQGEDMVKQVAKDLSYHDLITLDKYRAQCLSSPWGWETMLIPQFERATELYRPEEKGYWTTPEGRKAIDHLRGLVLVHGSNVWPGYGLTMDDVWKVQDKFGWDDKVQFFPYWEPNPAIALVSPLDPKTCVVSAYRRKEAWLLVLFNNRDQAENFTLRLGADPSAGNIVSDALHGQIFSISAAREVVIPVPAREYRLLAWPPLSP